MCSSEKEIKYFSVYICISKLSNKMFSLHDSFIDFFDYEVTNSHFVTFRLNKIITDLKKKTQHWPSGSVGRSVVPYTKSLQVQFPVKVTDIKWV